MLPFLPLSRGDLLIIPHYILFVNTFFEIFFSFFIIYKTHKNLLSRPHFAVKITMSPTQHRNKYNNHAIVFSNSHAVIY